MDGDMFRGILPVAKYMHFYLHSRLGEMSTGLVYGCNVPITDLGQKINFLAIIDLPSLTSGPYFESLGIRVISEPVSKNPLGGLEICFSVGHWPLVHGIGPTKEGLEKHS